MAARVLAMSITLLAIGWLECLGAEFVMSDIFTIAWGFNPDQLMIGEPVFNDVDETPDDTTDDYVELGGGPSYGFVDLHENLYFSSYEFMQLKAFNKSGGLIFDYSKGVPGYNREYFHGWLRDVYVDSLLIIYILGGASQDYLAVVDTAGNLIEKLSPYGDSSGVVVASTFFNSNDVITFLMYDKNYFTYMNGVFDEGGSPGWRAGDGYYYHANLIETNTFRFVKYEAPSITGQASNLQETIKVVDVPAAFDLHFLGVDDGMNLYVFETEQEEGKTRVLVFDTGFQLIDQIVFPDRGNRYLWYMNPFMRPSDGNIYEFRCLDDGLHVVRWSKQ